jgi:hypothetical protein
LPSGPSSFVAEVLEDGEIGNVAAWTETLGDIAFDFSSVCFFPSENPRGVMRVDELWSYRIERKAGPSEFGFFPRSSSPNHGIRDVLSIEKVFPPTVHPIIASEQIITAHRPASVDRFPTS